MKEGKKIYPLTIDCLTAFQKLRKESFDMQVFKTRESEAMKVVSLPLDRVFPNPSQPRKHFDSNSLEELTASIEEFGILQPITVRKVKAGYEIVAGERRWRAAENAGLDTIPAIVLNVDEKKSALLALLENLQRDDLTFFEIAESYQALIRNQGMTQEEIAKKIGKSQSTIANKLRLLRLYPRTKRLITEYALSERHARALLHLSDEESQILAVRAINDKKLNVSQTEELVKKMLKSHTPATQTLKLKSFQDLRVFTNTIKRALSVMRDGGVDADMQTNSFDWGVEYIIKVKN